jgi:hypothetical protein
MQDEISRNELTAQLELPRATVTSLVRDLIARGLVVTRESAVTGTQVLVENDANLGALGATGEYADLLGAVVLARHEVDR